MAKDEKVDVEALEKKRKKIKPITENPHIKEYGEKLSELLNLRADAMDNFVNWVTGLATGSMFLAFSNFASTPDNIRVVLLWSGIVSFLCIASAMSFKILLRVRFSNLELEVSILKNLWESHEIQTQLKEKTTRGEKITEKDTQKLLRNQEQSLNYLDEDYIERLKKPILLKSQRFIFSYWLTLALFFIGIILMASYYVLPFCCL